ncbi:transglutaminase family protein [Deinococcus sonorensis]|uniref:Transglutaminase family protein n=2 Tax=Deinococcus sonorensis TaxID=309891 RepID=A0AAU7U7M7_9DEIO
MRAEIRHVTEYRYAEPVWDSFNEIRLHPARDERQNVLAFDIRVTPDVPVTVHRDYFGGLIHHVHVHEPHTLLRIEARTLVVTYPSRPPTPAPVSSLTPHREPHVEYLLASPRVPTGSWPEVFGARRPQPDDDLPTFLLDLTRYLYRRFQYTPGATDVRTSLSDFAGTGRGVCQDYAHAMLGILRTVGIPARYVSGYIYAGADFVGAEASHAWVEAFIPGSGWTGYDPTNNTAVVEAHVKIGHGRDYSDVSPISGHYHGNTRGVLDVEVKVYDQ